MQHSPDNWCGRWTGSNLLRLSWLPEPDHRSATSATIAAEANGKFFSMRYRWQHDQVDHEGVLLFGFGDETNAATAAWCDSWHMSGRLLFCSGTTDASGTLSVLGSYAAPPGPDWGWRIELSMPTTDSLCMRMFNIEPGGEDDLAVQADFVRDPR
jgi:hypothetical protein